MEDFVVTCPLVSDTSHLISGSCSSPRNFGLDFLQTPPRDDALVLLLAFGSAITWQEDFHLSSFVPCPAHTSTIRRAALRRRRERSERIDCVVRGRHDIHLSYAPPSLQQ